MYPEGSVHYLVEEHLREMGKKAREFGKSREDDNGAAPAAEDQEEK